MNLVFAGTGAFGIPALEALCAKGWAPRLVVSQPDRPAGRRRSLTSPPLAARARELELPLFQPERLNRPEPRARIAAESPDALVVIAYGQILKPKVLGLPPWGCLNVHGSLLPRHRGASPVQAAILHRDEETGVSVMRMDEGLDTGPVFAARRTPIAPEETAGALHDRLAKLGAELLIEVLADLRSGVARAVPQDPEDATTCGLITKEDGRLDWSRPAVELAARVRAYTPWPGAFTFVEVRGKALRIGLDRVRVVDGDASSVAPGTILEAEGDALVVAAGEGALALEILRPAGKKAMNAAAFLRGYPVVRGDRLRAQP